MLLNNYTTSSLSHGTNFTQQKVHRRQCAIFLTGIGRFSSPSQSHCCYTTEYARHCDQLSITGLCLTPNYAPLCESMTYVDNLLKVVTYDSKNDQQSNTHSLDRKSNNNEQPIDYITMPLKVHNIT